MLCICPLANGQIVKDYFKLKYESAELPVLVRGEISSRKVMIFVQGGPGETAIDFARADYPRWKKTLEQSIAIAYYDQRGLNEKYKNIDSTKINYDQYGHDLLIIAKELKQRYQAEIYLMGHSIGGRFVKHLIEKPEANSIIEGAILVNTPITNDKSPERYQYYRPLYLKNLAKEMWGISKDTSYWKEAYQWVCSIDSITTRDEAIRWNRYVDSAFEPVKRHIGFGMAMKVLFARPYNPIKYLNRKDNERVDDLLWADLGRVKTFEELPNIQVPVLLITGRFDDIAPLEEQKAAHERIENARLVILPNAAHESFLDQPEEFNRAVLGFILE